MSQALSNSEIKVSAYDRVSSWLVALLVLIGTAVAVLFVIWLSKRVLLVPTAVPVPVEVVDLFPEAAGRGHHDAGTGRDEHLGAGDIDEPSEAPSDPKPDAAAPSMSDQIAALDAIASETAVSVDAPSESLFAAASAKPASATGDTYGLGAGGKSGVGDSRPPGPLREGREDIVPPFERWEIRWTTTGLQPYTKQLDFFKIELGAAGGGSSEIDYARNLQKPQPDRRSGKPVDENRVYMTWLDERNPLAAMDRQLLERAGINTRRRVLLQFLPDEVDKMLRALEGQTIGKQDPRTLLKTTFGVRAAGAGYEFHVLQVRYRRVPKF